MVSTMAVHTMDVAIHENSLRCLPLDHPNGWVPQDPRTMHPAHVRQHGNVEEERR